MKIESFIVQYKYSYGWRDMYNPLDTIEEAIELYKKTLTLNPPTYFREKSYSKDKMRVVSRITIEEVITVIA